MKTEYDFSKAERGKFYRKNAKFNLPVYLDDEVIEYFSALAASKGVAMEDILNDLLKKDIALIEVVK